MLRPETQGQLKPFLETLGRASHAVLLLDYDGTLAPFQVKRDEAYPYPGVVPILEKIMAEGRTRVVIITGRDARDVPSFLNLHPHPEILGIHGLQRLKADGTLLMPSFDDRTFKGLSDASRWLGNQELLDNAEFKVGAIAVHWRGLSQGEADGVRGRVLPGWYPVAKKSGLNLLEFDGGLEIRAAKADKGEAVRSILREIGPDVPVAYLGDDVTDEAAFQAIEGHGLSILVRETWRQTAAQFWLTPPDELLEFFGLWFHARAGFDAGAGAPSREVRTRPTRLQD